MYFGGFLVSTKPTPRVQSTCEGPRAVLPGVDAAEEQLHQKVAESKVREQQTLQRKPAQTSLSSAGRVRNFSTRVGILDVLSREYSVLSSKFIIPRTPLPSLFHREAGGDGTEVETSLLLSRPWGQSSESCCGGQVCLRP